METFDELLSALDESEYGDVIFVRGNAEIDTGEEDVIHIPEESP